MGKPGQHCLPPHCSLSRWYVFFWITMEHTKVAELSNQVHSRALANHVHGQKKVELKYWVERVTGTSGYDAFFSCYGGD